MREVRKRTESDNSELASGLQDVRLWKNIIGSLNRLYCWIYVMLDVSSRMAIAGFADIKTEKLMPISRGAGQVALPR